MEFDFSEINQRLFSINDSLNFGIMDIKSIGTDLALKRRAEESKIRADTKKAMDDTKKKGDDKIKSLDEKYRKLAEKEREKLIKKEAKVTTATKLIAPSPIDGGSTLSLSEINYSDCNNEMEDIVIDILVELHEKLPIGINKRKAKEILKKLRGPTVLSAIRDLLDKNVSKEEIINRYVQKALSDIEGES